jgi:hypothetical protein
MHSGHGLNIVESQTLLIFIHNLSRDFFLDDLGEDGILRCHFGLVEQKKKKKKKINKQAKFQFLSECPKLEVRNIASDKPQKQEYFVCWGPCLLWKKIVLARVLRLF